MNSSHPSSMFPLASQTLPFPSWLFTWAIESNPSHPLWLIPSANQTLPVPHGSSRGQFKLLQSFIDDPAHEQVKLFIFPTVILFGESKSSHRHGCSRAQVKPYPYPHGYLRALVKLAFFYGCSHRQFKLFPSPMVAPISKSNSSRPPWLFRLASQTLPILP